MQKLAGVLAFLFVVGPIAADDTLAFLTDAEISAFASEISGESAKRSVEGFSRHHRMRGSTGFRSAADQVVGELQRYGLTDAKLEMFPADGKRFYGTQRSRRPWNVDFAELWELDAAGSRKTRLASWDESPITLAQDSESADVRAELVDVGAGTKESDYAGKDVRGRIVLTSSQPSAIASLAVAKLGAAGILSYAQNQRTAWYGEDENLIRWGHLDTFAPVPTFAFMTSLKSARRLQQRLAAGETIRLDATVRAGQADGAYEIPMATIPGTDLREEEIIFSCHLDHPRPGANDNASGCAAILEVARTMSKLIGEKRIAPPRRTIRFVSPPEIEGTLALVNARPEIVKRTRAAIHLDMVGGGPETKAIFHVTRGPASLPSFVYDVAAEIGELINRETAQFAMTGTARWPLIAPTGGKDPLRAAMVPLTLGSDHQVWSDSSVGVPSVYLNDWPDRYIHTNADVPANIDSTKLGRAAFLAAATGYALATLEAKDAPAMVRLLEANAMERAAVARRRNDPNVSRFAVAYEQAMLESLSKFIGAPVSSRVVTQLSSWLDVPARNAAPSGRVYRRNPALRGTMSAFGYDYFEDHYAKHAEIRLKGDLQYEALNLVDGKRTTSEIRDALSAIYAPVSTEDVEQYLEALASINVIQPR
jgi:aminopeptidase YwaD